MALNFDTFRVIEVSNPSKDCVEIRFSDVNTTELKSTSLVVFEQQVKYVVTEENNEHKRVKIFVRDDESPIMIDFYPEEYHLYETFFLALYNKTI